VGIDVVGAERDRDLLHPHVDEARRLGPRLEVTRIGEREDAAGPDRWPADDAVHRRGHADAGHPRVVLHAGPREGAHPPTRGEHAVHLGEGNRRIGREHQAHARGNDVESVVRPIDRRRIEHRDVDVVVAGVAAAGDPHHPVGDVAQQDGAGRADELRPGAAEAPRTARQFEHPVARLDREALEQCRSRRDRVLVDVVDVDVPRLGHCTPGPGGLDGIGGLGGIGHVPSQVRYIVT
jgi:hypothetical protein